MDFSLEDTQELLTFRMEVRAWIEANLPPPTSRRDRRKETRQEFESTREFHRRLGAKGWRVPWAPKEYGAAALPPDKTTIVQQELDRVAERLAGFDDNGPGNIIPAILTYGTEQQKQAWGRGIIEGKSIWWQGLTEPEAGSDLANVQTTALRDGDSYVINGTKLFQGGSFDVDMMYLLAVTNLDRPRHHNLSVLCFPMNLKGISWSPMRLLSGDRNAVYFDSVRVPLSACLGPEGQGWQVNSALLEIEHGYGAISTDRTAPLVLRFLREGPAAGSPLVGDPVIRDRYSEIHMGVNVNRLLQLRNFSQRLNKQWGTYEGSQNALHGKTFRQLRQAQINLEVCGLYALVDDERDAPTHGQIEQHQRSSIDTHPIGTIEVHKVIMARRMGLSATQERAAATV